MHTPRKTYNFHESIKYYVRKGGPKKDNNVFGVSDKH